MLTAGGSEIMGPRHIYRRPSPNCSRRAAVTEAAGPFRAAARQTGVDAGYLCHLEHGRRVPSIAVALALVEGYGLVGTDKALLEAHALYGVGRDWSGSYPPP